jgi:hypothetical protein
VAIQTRSPTFAPIRQWNSAEAVRAQDEVLRNNILLSVAAPLPGIPVLRAPVYSPRRVWNSAEAVRAQGYSNLVGVSLFTPPIPRNFDYSVQPWNRLSSAAIKALADNYTNLVINTVPSPIIRPVDLSVQPWNGRIRPAAVSAMADVYANRLAAGFLVTPTPLPPRNYDYSVQPWNKLSAAAIKASDDVYANRLQILPEPGPLPIGNVSFDWPVYPRATKVSSAAINAWADNYVNRLASGFLPFVVVGPTPITRIPTPFSPITGGSGSTPGLPIDRIWYRWFDSVSRRLDALEEKK